MNLLISEILHLTLSLSIGLVLHKRYKSIWTVILPIVSGFLIDVDHLIDYFLYKGFYFNLSEFLSGEFFPKSGHVYILFHGWEYVLGLIIFDNFFPKYRKYVLPFALGMFFHLLFDQFSNFPNPLGYSIIYRYLHNFSGYIFANHIV